MDYYELTEEERESDAAATIDHYNRDVFTRLRAEAAALRAEVGALNDSLGILDICQIKPLVDFLKKEREVATRVIEAAHDVINARHSHYGVLWQAIDTELAPALNEYRDFQKGGNEG